VPAHVEVRSAVAGASDVLDCGQEVDSLILIDAALATPQLPVGTCLRLAYPAQEHVLSRTPICNTHAVSLAHALRLAWTLGQLPGEVTLFLLAGDSFEPGTRLSPHLRQPLARLVEAIQREVAT